MSQTYKYKVAAPTSSLSSNNSVAGGTNGANTYEQARAQSREELLPDKIAWNSETSYRNNPYRLLKHQHGVVGYVHVRLIEGKSLQLFQQQKQQQKQPVSAYALLHLSSSSYTDNKNEFEGIYTSSGQLKQDQSVTSSTISNDTAMDSTVVQTFRSSTVAESNNPVWPASSYTTNASTDPDNNNRASSSFRIPLVKGSIPEGSEVSLNVLMQHDPSSGSGAGGAFGILNILGNNNKDPSLSLGKATVNLTPLLMGEETILDIWVPLVHNNNGLNSLSSAATSLEHQQKTISSSNGSGKIRLLLSYEPEGLRPQLHDYVTLEAFARNSNNLIIQPIAQAMKVVATRGDYLLLQFRYSEGRNNNNHSKEEEGRVRVHRNTVFVIERVSFVDGVVDTILKPVDTITQFPVVQDVGHIIRPYANVLTDLAMPALLSGKLLLAVSKTAANAGITGIVTTVKVLVMAGAAAGNKREN